MLAEFVFICLAFSLSMILSGFIHLVVNGRSSFFVCVCLSLSHVWLFAAPWTVAHQAPPSKEFSRQDTGLPGIQAIGLPFPILGALSDPGIEPTSLKACVLGTTWQKFEYWLYNNNNYCIIVKFEIDNGIEGHVGECLHSWETLASSI